MRKQLLMLSAVCLLIVASCSKSNDNPDEQKNNSVSINGAVYSTIQVGNQTWTSVNYNGAGGANYNDGPNDPLIGKLYTLTEAKSVKLPDGWRLPSREDYNNLLGTLGATDKNTYGFYRPSANITSKLMAKTSWDNNIGTNESGFNAYATGSFNDNSVEPGFRRKGLEANFITTSFFTELGGSWINIPVAFNIDTEKIDGKTTTYVAFSDTMVRNNRGSIRFVKDNK